MTQGLAPQEVLYVKLLNYVRGWLEGREYTLALQALDFGRSRHTGTRKDNITPEFSHQLHIARYFMNVSGILPKSPERLLALIFLHDVYEDGYATLAEIETQFGSDIASGVRRLSKIRDGIKIPAELYHAEMLEDIDVILAKGGDKMHNIESMGGVFSSEKKIEYVTEAEGHTLPMLKKAKSLYHKYTNVLNLLRHTLIIYTKQVKEGNDLANI